jgi:hypothetical protein
MRFFEEIDEYYRHAGIKKFYTPSSKLVRYYNAFQSTEDLSNDFKAIFVKPLIHFYLSNVYHLKILYELYLTTRHLLTCSSDSLEHLSNVCLYTACAALCYCLLMLELLQQTLSFLTRLSISSVSKKTAADTRALEHANGELLNLLEHHLTLT